jgi:hypothetical protein
MDGFWDRSAPSRVSALPISNGASPVASALGIRSGATPRGPTHPNIQLQSTTPNRTFLLRPRLNKFLLKASRSKNSQADFFLRLAEVFTNSTGFYKSGNDPCTHRAC